MNRKLTLWIFALILSAGQAVAQQYALDPVKFHVFSPDSLAGFDDAAARASAISEGFIGDEFPVRMYQLKRRYINDKYNLVKKHTRAQHNNAPANNLRSKVQAACVNEDFEASANGSITVSNQIQGWTVSAGLNQNNSNSCNLEGCCPSQPKESFLFDAPNGIIDPVIGACYPIYSVFGDGPPNPNAAASNTHIEIPMRGNKFIRINSSNNNYSIEKLSKTFSVSASNALFQFAFISVFSPGHGCCDAGAFKISLPGISCPTFSASAPSSACTNTASGVQFLSVPSCTPYNSNTFPQYIFNKWQVSSMDLTPYIGTTVTIEIVATDCTAGGHFGYVYFDAQCGPMSILGNGTPFPAGDTNVIVPTCGPNGATICATPGLGPYSWAGPNIPSGYAIPSFSNQCFTTSISATYTLYMNPPGGCNPFTRIVTTTITPAPTIVATATQATCGDSIATINVVTGGSAGNPKFIQWYPSPLTLNGTTTQATYLIPKVNQPTLIVSIFSADQNGCPVSTTVGINPPAPVPDFTLQNNTGTHTITCKTPTVNISANTTYTYGPYNYFWSNPSFTSSAASVTLNQSGMYVLMMQDAISKCYKTDTVYIGVNTSVPVSAMSHQYQFISCVQSATLMTFTANSPTVNFKHTVSSPLGGDFSDAAQTMSYMPGTPGTYTYVLENLVNGCKTIKNFTIASSDGFPTFSLTSQRSFTIGCNARAWADVNITGAQSTPTSAGAVSYSLLLPGGASVSPATASTVASYTVYTPGNYTVITTNVANGCETRIPISVLTNTLPPTIDTIYSGTRIVTCFTPSTTLKGVSFSPGVNYNWKMPPNLTKPGDELTVVSDPANATQSIVGVYTLEVQYAGSTCLSTTTVEIAQNVLPPVAAASGTNFLTCTTQSVLLSNNSTPDPGNPFPTPAPVAAILWEGPSPQVPLENKSSYVAYWAGDYTMTVRDMNNGCTNTVIVQVPENRVYPVLNNPVKPAPVFLDCGAQTATVPVIVSSNTANLVYSWETASSVGTPTFVDNSQFTPSLQTTHTGTYQVTVTDTENGCVSTTTMSVGAGVLTVTFTANKQDGFAPLTVDFTNQSTSSLGSEGIQSVWVFGNGTTSDTTLNTLKTTYEQPGTYMVTLFASKGACLDTATMMIVVDIPSEMKIPNVFTPNEDGVNDVFHLQRSSNLTQIKAAIYDRWGNKVYEVDSPTGQIEWDGKNQFGKPVPSGQYFYIISATRRDGKPPYDEKGTLTLIR